jgi:hypothetical protein
MSSDQSLPQTQAAIPGRDLGVSKHLKAFRFQSGAQIREQVYVVECPATQAYAIQRRALTNKLGDSDKDLDQSVVESLADCGNGHASLDIFHQRFE